MAKRCPPLTQRQLARETELSTTTVNQLCRNKVKRIDVGTVDKLCDYFGCEVGDLFVVREMQK